MNVLLEESANLKERMIKLTEENNSLKSQKAKLAASIGAEFRSTIER